ncbi:MAG: hypothetical protein A3H29_12825 [Acidobacteria bacterium RIFCSPLOWO2_02_FULL_67_21]|nr:MAG: hypothetical protein A3H29_12825 [Acidobacteria bacterium RIFCSPLOWO2_02_FULL_67_21]
MADVFQVLLRMREERVVLDYAIGGATAVLFYAEPTRTYDLDVFALLPSGEPSLASLGPIYEWARTQGFAVDAEHLLIHGVPVQILPAYDALVAEAVRDARLHDYEGTPVRVVDPEHLVALALQTGGARRRERAWQLLQADVVNRPRLQAILDAHGIDATLPGDD